MVLTAANKRNRSINQSKTNSNQKLAEIDEIPTTFDSKLNSQPNGRNEPKFGSKLANKQKKLIKINQNGNQIRVND